VQQDITRENIEIQVIERRKQIEIEEQEILRKSKEVESKVKRPAEAQSYQETTLAEGERFRLSDHPRIHP